jgi:hypothetical protein
MKTALTVVLVALGICCGAQTRVLPITEAIDTILRDFPCNLRHITGELVLAQGEFENYASMVQLADAGDCIITRWHSTGDTTVSWQAQVYTGDDFDAAEKRYHQLFRQLHQCYMRMPDSTLSWLSGDWEAPKEGVAFTTSTLQLKTGDWRYREVQVQVELVYDLADWAVRVNIISKKPDDEVGGEKVVGLRP